MNSTERTTLIIAVVLALFLWAYVRITQTPEEHRTIRSVPVTIAGTAVGGLAVSLYDKDAALNIDIIGPAERVSNVSREDVRAEVDISGVTDVQHKKPLPVKVSGLPKGVRVANSGLKVPINVVPLEQRSFPVQVGFITQPPPGTTVGEYRISPAIVTVEGSHQELETVKYVTVQVDPSQPLTAEQPVVPQAVNKKGEWVKDVRILTSAVKVGMASLTGEQTVRPVAVRLPVLRNMPRRFTVTARVRPDTVTLSGNAALLAQQPAYVETEPIDVSALRRDTTRTVRLRVPHGLTVVEGAEVRVDLQVHPME
ncbi:MAG: CdaR family protein [Armatimonadota bacterium]